MRVGSRKLVVLCSAVTSGLPIALPSPVALTEARHGDAAPVAAVLVIAAANAPRAVTQTPNTGGPLGADPASDQPDPPPIAYQQRVVAERDRTVSICLSGSSVVGRPLRFLGRTGPSHGVLRPVGSSPINLATIRYTPATGYVGPDEFTFVVSDGTTESAPARVAIDVVTPGAEPPSDCPQVYFDSDRNFVVDGDKVFPFGFWVMYPADPPGGWAEYATHFNSLMGGSSPIRNAAMQRHGVYLQAQGVLRYDEHARGGPRFEAVGVARARHARNIISWEVWVEPDYYAQFAALLGNVALQAQIIRDADPCNRPVMVTPQASAGPLFTEWARHTDYTVIQWYPTPIFPLRTLALHIDKVKARIGKQPFVYAYRTTGYQPMRYREMRREPTAREVRAATYLAVIHGASGVSFFSYSQGVADNSQYGFAERGDAWYCISDSPKLYAGVKRLGLEIKRTSPLFLSPRSATTAISDSPDIECAIWDLNGTLPGGEYLVCVNVADEPSPYFEHVSGDVCEQMDACLLTPDGRSYPARQQDYRLRAIRMSPSRLHLKRVDTGVWNRAESVNRVRIHFGSAPAGARFQFALYSDQHRDLAPGRKLCESRWRAIPTGGGWVEIPLSSAVRLEHTRAYFLAARVNRDGVTIWSQDVRYGTRAKAGTNTLRDGFPPLHRGHPARTTISLKGGTFSHYCATRSLDDKQCAPGVLTANRITDTFEPHAVHIYQLIP